MKTCSKCGETKSLAEFSKSNTRKIGIQAHCKKCKSADFANRRRENPVKYQTDFARYRRKHNYGLSEAQFSALLEAQDNSCKICGVLISGQHGESEKNTARACVDHDHQTGEVRGLLCQRCNLALGLLDDSPNRLIAAAAYLQKTS